MGELANKTKENKIRQQSANEVVANAIKSQWSKIMAVAPKHLNEQRLYQLTISAVNRDPKLLTCDFATLLSSVMRCSALGIEPSSVDGLGRAYILPFYNGKAKKMEATFILGYKGMIDLARRSGEVASISAHAVYEGDVFEYEFGLNEKLRHVPATGVIHSDDKLTHVYMVCHFKDGGHYMEVMTKDEVDAIRKRSKASKSGPWVTDYEAMAKKTVIRRAFPYLPVSIEAQAAAAADETDGGLNFDEIPTPVIQEEPTGVVDVETGEILEAVEDEQAPQPELADEDIDF